MSIDKILYVISNDMLSKEDIYTILLVKDKQEAITFCSSILYAKIYFVGIKNIKLEQYKLENKYYKISLEKYKHYVLIQRLK